MSDGEEVGALLSSAQALLFDCDGVLWHGDDVIPGAMAALARLRGAGKKVRAGACSHSSPPWLTAQE